MLPSILLAICCSFPLLALLQSFLFTADMGFKRAPVPSFVAFLQALLVGLLIPALSAGIPIAAALSKTLVTSISNAGSRMKGVKITLS